MAHQQVISNYMEHGYCLDWEKGLVSLHVASDVITGIAYYSITIAMLYFALKRKDIPFKHIYFLFAAFIISCGTTHFFSAYTIFVPAYWSEGYVKAFTATISAVSAILFIPLIPKAIAMPSLAKALDDNRELTEQLQKKIVETEQSEVRFHAIFDASDEAIFIHDTRTGAILGVNETMCRMYGYAQDEALKVSVEDLSSGIPPYTQTEALNRIRRAVSGEPQQFEWHARHKDGRLFWVEVHIRRALIGSDNRILVTARDISERKTAEAALRASEGKFRSLLESVQLLAVILDTEGKITFCNDFLLSMTGWAHDDVIGCNWFEKFIPDDERTTVQAVFKEAIANNAVVKHYENVILTQRGSKRMIVWNNTTLYDMSGAVMGVASLGTDVTEHRNTEEQLRQSQKMEAIGQLAAGVAHDFNNILTIISGYSSLLLIQNSLNEQQKEKIKLIGDASEKAAQLTRGLLAFSRKQQLNVREEDLNDIVRRMQKFLVRIIGEDIRLYTTCFGADLPVSVDKGQVEQVMINLATNARDAMHDGGSLSISTDSIDLDRSFFSLHGYEARPGSYAVLTISDNGEGIDVVHLRHIFEPFFTTKGVGKGTGLGLSIIYGIVKQHDGFINVYSEVGKGTTFRIYFPIVEKSRIPDIEKPEDIIPVGGDETILVVEDDRVVRTLFERILEDHGYTVIIAEDGMDAVEKFKAKAEKINLILMDMIMPKMNGKDAYDEIRRIKPDLKVLFSSGYTADFIENRGGLEEGFELIMKPVQPMELLRKIREMLDA